MSAVADSDLGFGALIMARDVSPQLSERAESALRVVLVTKT